MATVLSFRRTRASVRAAARARADELQRLHNDLDYIAHAAPETGLRLIATAVDIVLGRIEKERGEDLPDGA